MFHHPQNIPSIIRTQRLMEQQEYSIIIRRPKEQIHWRRTRFHQSSGPKGWWNNKNIPSSSEDPKRRLMMKEKNIPSSSSSSSSSSEMVQTPEICSPPLTLVWSFWKSMKQHHHHHHHHHLIFLLIVWLVKPTWLWVEFFCVFVGINGHESLLQITLVCNLRDRERERERERDPPHPMKLQIVIVGLGFVNEH